MITEVVVPFPLFPTTTDWEDIGIVCGNSINSAVGTKILHMASLASGDLPRCLSKAFPFVA